MQGKHGIVAERSFALFSGRRLADDDVLDERFDALTTIMIITQALKPPDPRPAAVEMIRLNVRHGADTIMIDVSPSWTWQEVKERALAVGAASRAFAALALAAHADVARRAARRSRLAACACSSLAPR